MHGPDATLSYGEIDRLANRIARALTEFGVRKGDRVGLWLEKTAKTVAAMQGILSGRLPAEGPGVRIALQDPAGTVRPATMLNMLEELRNAGAEAIQLGDRRVTASSAFTGAPGAILLDGAPLDPPYVWLVIGDPDTIATALEIPGGALAYVRNDGGSGDVTKVQHVAVDALRDLPDPRFATLAPVPAP